MSSSSTHADPGVPQTTRAALSQYGAGLADASVSRIGRGLIHETFLVDTVARKYVLQRLNPIFSVGVHANIAAVTERLAARGVETPLLERTAAGALYADLAGDGCWRLMSFVDGVSRDTCDGAPSARAAGALVGRFHTALHGLAHDFAPLGFPFHDTPRHLADLEEALVKHRDHPLHADVAEIASAIRRVVRAWQVWTDLPERVVHLDLKFNNVLFAPDDDGPPRAICLIDLDTLSRRPLWVELGDAWRSWCNQQREHEPVAELSPAIFEASAEGWLETLEIPLSRKELASLAEGVERLSLELCSRFAADALEERYFGWNRDLFETAGEHNLSRARGQLSLNEQARQTRGDRLRFLLG